MLYELYVWLYAYSCSILRCFQLTNYSFLSVSRFCAKNDCSYSFWVFRLNFMLNFVYIFQAIVIFLTGIVSLILAKLESFFVNFKSISNIKWSYMSGSHRRIVYKLTKLCFFDNFMVSFVNFSRSHNYMKTSLVVFMIKTAVMRCVMWLFKARAVYTSKNCRLD